MKKLALFGLGLVLIGAGCSSAPEVVDEVAEETQEEVNETTMEFVQLSTEEITGKQIRISTDKGDIVMELYPETAPMAVSNMINLAQEGFYNGVVFHRREEGFVIQGGDPEGTGRGGPGYTFADELNDEYTYEKGVLAMANRGPDTNGSQFFIMLDDTGLPKAYTIFGRVTEGLDIVDAIVVGDVMNTVTVEDVAAEAVAE
jgi:peptidyl-prolyl cis-trans isomerase B (cyclophilin B)